LLFDYDAAFVAYINGYEFKRVNIGKAWDITAHTEVGDVERKAKLVDNGNYEEYIFKDYQINNRIKNGDNVLAIQIHSSSTSPTKLAAFFNLLVGIKDSTSQFAPAPTWYSPPPMFADYSTLQIVRFTSPRLDSIAKQDGTMEITWNGKGEKNYFDAEPNYYNGKVVIKTRGNSTHEFPKKSIRVETRDSAGNNLNLKLFGFPSENDWVLYAPYTDKSLLRNYVMYNIAGNMLEWAPRTQLVEVMHNGYYLGVYVFMEKIKVDKNRVDIQRMDKNDTIGNSLTGGYMTKVDWQHEFNPATFTNIHGSTYPYYSDITYEHLEPSIDSIHPKQKKYIEDFYYNFEDNLLTGDFADPSTGYRKYISEESFADYMILNEISKDIDSYRYSTFFYKNHILNDGLMHLGPAWDYNFGMGNVNFGTEGAQFTKKWMYNKEGKRIWWFVRLIEDPQFAETFNCRWDYYRNNRGVISKEYQFKVIDDAIAEMGEAVTRNHYHWQILGRYVWPNFFVGDTYEEEIDYLKNWIGERIDWIDINIPGECNMPVTVKEIEPLVAGRIKVFPNPASNQITIAALEQITNLTLVDMNGRTILELNDLTGHSQILSIANLTPGIYFIQADLENGSRVVVEVVKAS